MSDNVTGLTPEVLRGVLEREEIAVLFQPIFDLRSGETHGFEAFTRGPVGTDLEEYETLYRVATIAGLLPELDRVCRRKAIHGATHLSVEHRLFVKMFPLSAHYESLKGKELIDLLDGGPDPQQLVWEISELKPIENFPAFEVAMADWTQIGCQLAVDNFGRGYSGLDKIIHVKPDYIKLAKELVSDIHASFVKRELVSTLQTLAKNIGAKLVATGVESTEELEVVQKIGVDLVQGFLLARPSQSFQTNPSIEL